jgi:predicted alpha/beta-fold hydrolase
MAAGDALGRGFALNHAAFPRDAEGLVAREARAPSRDLRRRDRAPLAHASRVRQRGHRALHGFRDTDDYWTRASAKPLLANIRVPTLVINARDDPFLPESALPTQLEVSDAVKLEFPARGGHVGFVSGPFPGNLNWLPSRIFHFFEHHE